MEETIMKLKKKNMTKFDYIARKIFGVSMVALALTLAFLLPVTAKLQDNVNALNKEVQTLENEKSVLLNDLAELENPTQVMENED